MTLISDTLRRNPPHPSPLTPNPPGYTLLEILVVMALIGLMAGIAIPRLNTVYESVKWAGERDDALRRIAGLGVAAFQKGRGFELKRYPPDNREELPLELPVGWTLEADSPIRYRPTGVCLGGSLRLRCGERSIFIILRPPLCRPDMRDR